MSACMVIATDCQVIASASVVAVSASAVVARASLVGVLQLQVVAYGQTVLLVPVPSFLVPFESRLQPPAMISASSDLLVEQQV